MGLEKPLFALAKAGYEFLKARVAGSAAAHAAEGVVAKGTTTAAQTGAHAVEQHTAQTLAQPVAKAVVKEAPKAVQPTAAELKALADREAEIQAAVEREVANMRREHMAREYGTAANPVHHNPVGDVHHAGEAAAQGSGHAPIMDMVPGGRRR